MTEEVEEYKVIIVGGGVAGLAAAGHLISRGHDRKDILLLEARNRLGGRVISVQTCAVKPTATASETSEQRIELGANWIHGVLGNPMYELAMAHGLVDIVPTPRPHRVIAATETGGQVAFSVLHEIYEAYVCFMRRCEEYYLCQYSPPDGIDSVGEHVALEASLYLDRLPPSQDKAVRKLIFDCLLKRETCISGCHSMNEIDLLELGSYTELQGGNVVLPSGYSSILEPLSRAVPPECIRLGHAVSSIKWRSSHRRASVQSPGEDSGIGEQGDDSDASDDTVVEDSPNASPNRSSEVPTRPVKKEETPKPPDRDVEVTCENGKKFRADHLICAIPLGVLKEKAATMFSPKLPRGKTEAIDRMLFGTVDKIFLLYDRPFLNPTVSEVMLLWDNYSDDPALISDNWFKKIYSFSKVSETVLLGWISGREAEYMETLSSDVVSEKCTEILRKFLNDPYVPKPQKCICTSWHKQPYSRGSYTAIAVGASQMDIEEIAQPCYSHPRRKKPTLLFAGEHTHSNFYSTVHGAYLTGRTAAQQLLVPDQGEEIVMDCTDTSDLSSWIQGMHLDS